MARNMAVEEAVFAVAGEPDKVQRLVACGADCATRSTTPGRALTARGWSGRGWQWEIR